MIIPKYNLKREVSWKEILFILNWNLQRRITDYPHRVDYYNECMPEKAEELCANELRRIERAYLCCHELRGFLGYYTLTKAEREARALLENDKELLSSDNKS